MRTRVVRATPQPLTDPTIQWGWSLSPPRVTRLAAHSSRLGLRPPVEA